MAVQQVVLLQLHNQLVLLELQWLQRPPLLLQLPVLPMPQVEVKNENAEKANTMITAIRHLRLVPNNSPFLSQSKKICDIVDSKMNFCWTEIVCHICCLMCIFFKPHRFNITHKSFLISLC